jgi:hypothetical protein
MPTLLRASTPRSLRVARLLAVAAPEAVLFASALRAIMLVTPSCAVLIGSMWIEPNSACNRVSVPGPLSPRPLNQTFLFFVFTRTTLASLSHLIAT